MAVFTLTLRGPGSQRLFVTENKPYVDFSLFVSWFPKLIPTDQIKKGVTRDQLQAICSLASSEKDRKLIRFAACKAQGLSNKKARKEYGIHCLGKLNEEVEDALSQAEELRKAVNTLANVEEKATLQALMLSKDELEPWMKDKAVDCIRVDGAGDEGPSHHEVQFYGTERNFLLGKKATIVTTRHSGGSYLNRVEMQNGCLTIAHSNLFIPSTLTGPNITGQGLDYDRLATNLDVAIDVYINRVNGAPCGES